MSLTKRTLEEFMERSFREMPLFSILRGDEVYDTETLEIRKGNNLTKVNLRFDKLGNVVDYDIKTEYKPTKESQMDALKSKINELQDQLSKLETDK